MFLIWNNYDVFVFIAFLVIVSLIWLKMRSEGYVSQFPLPPGPKGLPLIGNLFDLPREKEWLTFAAWGRKYGPISFVKSFSTRIVILDTYDAAYDLLEKRSAIYSDRTHNVISDDWMGWGRMTIRIPYGDRLQKHRWLLHKFLQPSAMKNYTSCQTQTTRQLLRRLLEAPDDFVNHIRSASGSTILKLVYDHEVNWDHDELISLAEDGLRWLAKVQEPGAYLVDTLPWLRYFPDWFPGTGWKKDIQTSYKVSHDMIYKPFEVVKNNILAGIARPCMASEALENSLDKNGNFQEEDLIADVLSTAYAGGADTTVSSILSALLAFLLYPQVLEKAQLEIDKVVGKDRLPTFEDRVSLPYIEAIVREIIRWNPVAPIGIPHHISTDDVYNGYFIPAGSTVIANSWSILHNENMYPEPLRFWPERWLDKDGKILSDSEAPMHPKKAAFGFGRRICPGLHFADNTIYIQLSSVISAFDIEKANDENGIPINPTIDYSSGIVSHPKPFKCVITPRSPNCSKLINETEKL